VDRVNINGTWLAKSSRLLASALLLAALLSAALPVVPGGARDCSRGRDDAQSLGKVLQEQVFPNKARLAAEQSEGRCS